MSWFPLSFPVIDVKDRRLNEEIRAIAESQGDVVVTPEPRPQSTPAGYAQWQAGILALAPKDKK